MPPDSGRTLVVGTTADYIDWIRTQRPGEALFLTDPAVRQSAEEPAPGPDEELLCDLADEQQVLAALAAHLARWQLTPAGVACYDCESLALAARLAGAYGLPYASVQSIANCRDKYRTKSLWRSRQIDTPAVCQVGSATAAMGFFLETGGPIVLKPASGSGSEFVFRCDSATDCERHYKRIVGGLQQRRGHRLYRSGAGNRPQILAEALVDGEEYSCDFVLEDHRATPVRLARKVRFGRSPFGTANAYILPGTWPEEIERGVFEDLLRHSARALGLERAVCMLDFMLCRGRVVLLELTPRPGGDCLPDLVRRCYGLDLVSLMLDFGRRQPVDWHRPPAHAPLVGLRLHAEQEGRLVRIDDSRLRQDPRVQEIRLTRKPGHIVKRPPVDYDAWLLGHALFIPEPGRDIDAQCRELSEKLLVEVA
jgi:biotin carboxylase